MDHKYFPFTGEPYKPAMGLRPLELKDWIEIDATNEKRLLMKEKIFRENKDLVLQINPEAEDACFELEEMVREHVLQYFPDQFSMAASELYVNSTGYSFSQPQTAEQALMNASQYVQEDFAFLSSEPPIKLIGGSICFPSRWNLKEKMNLNSEGIHAPVPKFQQTIGKPTETFMEKVSVDKPMQRFNWTLHDTDHIFTPFPSNDGRTDITKDNVLDVTYVRYERQTLRRMPKTKKVLFTIRTYVHPVSEIVAVPEKRELLKQTLLGLPQDVAEYRGMRRFFDVLKAALD